jgi:undecaprenyl-diphosphatase
MDWTIFHALNGSLRGDDGAQDAAVAFNATAIFVLVAAAGLLWFVARPGGPRKPKVAALSAGAATGVALLGNVLLGQLWFQSRPFVGHPHQTVLLIHHAADNSFPSDHASVAFAIAFAVLASYRRLGLLLLAAAAAIGIDRVFLGVHYPIDIAVSLLVGLASALLVTRTGRVVILRAVDQLSKISDPVVAAARTAAGRRV